MEEQGVLSQKLLLPQTFDLPPRDAEWIARNMSILQKMGIRPPRSLASDGKSPGDVMEPLKNYYQELNEVAKELKKAQETAPPAPLEIPTAMPKY